MTATAFELESALFQWEEGYRHLESVRDDDRLYRQMGRVVLAVEDELRRRIGPTFTAAELADLYGCGTDWCLSVANETVPGRAARWDAQALADAAFHLYLRNATDFAGGRIRVE